MTAGGRYTCMMAYAAQINTGKAAYVYRYWRRQLPGSSHSTGDLTVPEPVQVLHTSNSAYTNTVRGKLSQAICKHQTRATLLIQFNMNIIEARRSP